MEISLKASKPVLRNVIELNIDSRVLQYRIDAIIAKMRRQHFHCVDIKFNCFESNTQTWYGAMILFSK